MIVIRNQGSKTSSLLYISVVVFCFCLFNSVSISAQDYLLVKDGRSYYYKGKEYKCKELGPVYEGSEEATRLYKKGRKQKNVSTFLGVSGAIGIGTGLGILTFSNGSDISYGGILILCYSLIFEAGAALFSYGGRDKLENARNIFNNERIEKFGYESEGLSLSLENTENGMGLVLRF